MLAKMTPAERKSVRLKIQKASLLFMFKFVIAKVLASFCYLICGFPEASLLLLFFQPES